jgi:hypothetical protein
MIKMEHVLKVKVHFLIFNGFRFFQNMFLAIINDTYSEVKAEVNARKEAFQVSLIYSE